MHHISAKQHINKQLTLGLTLVCFGLSLGDLPAAAAAEAKKDPPASTSQKSSDLSTDNLQKQISDLDGQIQKLREQSLVLQEKTRAKLQEQLDGLRQQSNTLIPRIEKLRDNSETAWQDIKENIQKTIEDLKTSVDTMKK